jgi:hypothetical protein
MIYGNQNVVKGLKPMLTRLTRFKILASSLCVVFAGAFPAQAQETPDSEEERLAKRLANPIAALISVPFQFNYDSDIGPADDGERATLNIQPVIPIALNEDWNVISRTIVPIIWQDDIFPGAVPYMGRPVTLTKAPNGAIANKKILDGIEKVGWLKPTIDQPAEGIWVFGGYGLAPIAIIDTDEGLIAFDTGDSQP